MKKCSSKSLRHGEFPGGLTGLLAATLPQIAAPLAEDSSHSTSYAEEFSRYKIVPFYLKPPQMESSSLSVFCSSISLLATASASAL